MGTVFNMEQANFTTQSLQDTVVMVSAMKQANVQMKQQFKQIDIDSVEVCWSIWIGVGEDINRNGIGFV